MAQCSGFRQRNTCAATATIVTSDPGREKLTAEVPWLLQSRGFHIRIDSGGLMTNGFRRIADVTASVVGSPWTFTANIALTALWLVLGPVFGFSDTWQLTMNTAASQVTFLVAFLLQNTQNRDTLALQLKLDELIRSTAGARPQLAHLEELDDDQLEALKQEFEQLRERRGRRAD
jgi:low affinity Fe/Cu permease